jgi:hypothetical protein
VKPGYITSLVSVFVWQYLPPSLSKQVQQGLLDVLTWNKFAKHILRCYLGMLHTPLLGHMRCIEGLWR